MEDLIHNPSAGSTINNYSYTFKCIENWGNLRTAKFRIFIRNLYKVPELIN